MLGPDSALVTGRFAGGHRYKGNEENSPSDVLACASAKDGHWRVRHEHASLVQKPETCVTG